LPKVTEGVSVRPDHEAYVLEQSVYDPEIPSIARENNPAWRREPNAAKVVGIDIWELLQVKLWN
jgi:hypothetical protein